MQNKDIKTKLMLTKLQYPKVRIWCREGSVCRNADWCEKYVFCPRCGEKI